MEILFIQLTLIIGFVLQGHSLLYFAILTYINEL